MAAAAADWSRLHHDILNLIVGRLGPFDYLCCRAVCRSWRSAFHRCRARSRNQPRFLPLARSELDRPLLFSVRDLRSYPLFLPEFRHHRPVGFSQGWLFAVDPYVEIQLHAIDTLTRTRLTLPPTTPLPGHSNLPCPRFLSGNRRNVTILYLGFLRIQVSLFFKAILCPSPVPSPASFTAVAIVGRRRDLVFTRAGDTSWTQIKSPSSELSSFADVMFRDGRLHALTTDGELAVINLGDNSTSCELVSTGPRPRRAYCLVERRYLVESGGRLLQVVKGLQLDPMESDPPTATIKTVLEVFRFHESWRQWINLTRLGPYALFLGFNQCILLPVQDFPKLRRNCIYFAYEHIDLLDALADLDVLGSKIDIGQFCLKDGRTEVIA